MESTAFSSFSFVVSQTKSTVLDTFSMPPSLKSKKSVGICLSSFQECYQSRKRINVSLYNFQTNVKSKLFPSSFSSRSFKVSSPISFSSTFLIFTSTQSTKILAELNPAQKLTLIISLVIISVSTSVYFDVTMSD